MPISVRFSAFLAATAALALCAGARVQAQSTASPTAGNGTYIAADPLANVRYDNRYDLSLGMGYRHIKAGPNALQGANLGGFDLSGSYWFSTHFGVEGTGRGYFGTSGVGQTTSVPLHGPFISEYIFAAGPEWLGPHNKHGAISAHALFGGAYGEFEQDLGTYKAQDVNFYNTQLAPAAVLGGHLDLNRSARWVFRITPDAVVTRYGINYGNNLTQTDVNFAISVGVEYKFETKRYEAGAPAAAGRWWFRRKLRKEQ
jgi:hypothetical protein